MEQRIKEGSGGLSVEQQLMRKIFVFLLTATGMTAGAAETKDTYPTTIDLNDQVDRQVIVDRETGQYLGHPTTCLLEDGMTILCVYPKGHGRGPIIYKRSTDGGRSWSDRLPTPASWATSQEVPTLHRVVGPDGKKRIIMWSGLYPARLAVTENDGTSWSELKPVGDWGGIVIMGFVEALKTGKGHYLAMFHDDGRFFTKNGKRTGLFRLYKTFSED
ncbi:MAG: sialidase family protein, partial [Pirellulales bacterium]